MATRSISLRVTGLAVAAGFVTGLVLAAPAAADPMLDLREAIASARSETSCVPLNYHSTVEQAAGVFNQMTDDYLSHTATRVQNKDTTPGSISDPLPGLKNLGYGGTKAYLLQGAQKSEARATKATLLQGYASNKISDCSYTDFGVDMRRNPRTGYELAAVVLATP